MAAVLAYSALDAVEDDVGGDGLPVLTYDVPLDRGEAEFAGCAEDIGAAGSVGRPEVVDGGAEGVLNCGVGVGEFWPDAGCGLPGQPGVVHGVVADEVAGGGDGSGDGWALADEAADHEEGGADLMLREDFEEALGGDVVGAVVVGEGDLVGIGAGDEDFSEELGLGGEGRVGCGRCGGGEQGGGDGG